MPKRDFSFHLIVVVIALLLCATYCTGMAEGRYAQAQIKKVPIERLIANLEKALTPEVQPKERARILFQIGRLHAMAFAIKTETAEVAAIPHNSELQVGDQRIELPFYGYGTKQFHQFAVSQTKESDKEAAAQKHLKASVSHMRQAVQADPGFLPARLSLAWDLDQSGQKTEAKEQYRKVLDEAWEREKASSGGMSGDSITVETAGYLKNLLDPKKDAAEIAVIDERLKKLGSLYRAVTPIVVPTEPGVPVSEMMTNRPVLFDLDGRGAKSYAAWPTHRAAWLVYRSADENIDSGLQMFGQCTFWIFWRDGYEALSALDDDRDGFLKGRELKGLALWKDADCDGVCSEDELHSLEAFSIRQLSCRAARHQNGMPFSKGGVVFSDGRHGDSFDWLVPQSKR